MTTPRSNLAVLVDGVPLPPEEARELWQRFSDWMEEHRGDLAGFAAHEGYASVFPGVDQGRPVLLASKSAPQRPYGPAQQAASRSGGSEDRHDRPAKSRSGQRPGPGKRRK